MPTEATITVHSLQGHGDVKIINVVGELDETNLPQFEEVLNPLVADESVKVFIFNLMDLKFMNSKVVGYFAYLYTTLSKFQRRIIFACYNQNIKDILQLVGLDKLVESQATLEGAIQAAYVMKTQ